MSEATDRGRRALLRRVPIFRDLADSELDGLLRLTVSKPLRRHEVLFRKGDEGHNAYIIVRGRLKVMTSGADGRDFVFRILEPGEVLGELALLDRNPRSATVEAMEPAELLVIQRRELVPFLRSHPDVALKLLTVLSIRLREINKLLEDKVFLGLQERLARGILSLAKRFGRSEEGGTRINLKLSQQELGELLGTSRESINKQIRAWSSEGVLSMDHGFITIHDAETLEALAELPLP